jgi:hypothetical protein
MKAFWMALVLGIFLPRPGGAQGSKNLTAAKRKQVETAYHALAKQDLEKQKVDALPTNLLFVRVDVSEKIRSASFGHTTTLLVPAGEVAHPTDPNAATEFYIEYGKSTNAPIRWFGPFKLDTR